MNSVITTHFPDLTVSQQNQIAKLGSIYQRWNQKINLISRKDIHNVYLHHILHSLSIAQVISFQPDAQILDVGTGGGFPGVPLAILFPQTQFLLVDSIAKKIKIVDAVAKELGLTNLETCAMRAEKLQGKYDFVVARAVTRPLQIWQWIAPLIKSESVHYIKNGLLYLTGDQKMEELDKLGLKSTKNNLIHHFPYPYFESKILLHLFKKDSVLSK